MSVKLISGAGKLPCSLPAPQKTARTQVEKLQNCTLCGSSVLEFIDPEKDRRFYYHCRECHLIFVDPVFHPSRQAEVARYLEHNNGIDDPGYVQFLNRIIEPAFSFIEQGSVGLDYGCGPAPTLSKIIRQKGVTCYDYDPLFDFDHPLEVYDFIFATECLEHFHHPEEDIRKILELLRPGGHLFLMTERWETVRRFHTWYYKRDPTHVSFYHTRTFEFLKNKYQLSEKFSDSNRVMILKYK